MSETTVNAVQGAQQNPLMRRQQSPEKSSQPESTSAPVARKTNPFAGKKVTAEQTTKSTTGSKDIFSDLSTPVQSTAGDAKKRAFPFGNNMSSMGVKQRKLK